MVGSVAEVITGRRKTPVVTELPEEVAEKLEALGEPIAEFAVTGRQIGRAHV